MIYSCSSPLFITNNNIELYKIIEDDKIGYIDQKGKLRIKAEFERCSSNFDYDFCTEDFYAGELAIIKLNSKFGLINQKGEIVLEPTFDVLEWTVEPHNFIAKKGNKYGVINSKGETILPFIFDSRYFLIQNEIFHNSIDGQNYYYNPKTGKKTKSEYDYSTPFTFKYSVVQKNGKYGLINKKLETVIKPKYDKLGNYRNGLINAKIGNKWVFINKENKVVIDDNFEFASSFQNGIATVKKNKYGAIDSLGNILIPFKYEYLSYEGNDPKGIPVFQFSNKENYFSYNSKNGLINIKRDTILEPKYSDIFYLEDIAQVSSESGVGIIDIKKNKIIIPMVFDSVNFYEFGLSIVFYSDDEGNEYFGYINRRKKIIWAQNKKLLLKKLKNSG